MCHNYLPAVYVPIVLLTICYCQCFAAAAGGGGKYLDLNSALTWLDEDVRDALAHELGESHSRALAQHHTGEQRPSAAFAFGAGDGGNGAGNGVSPRRSLSQASGTASSSISSTGSMGSSSSIAFRARRVAEKRCRGTRGGWCGALEQQQPVAMRPPPRGNKTCPRNCSGVGNCNYDTGTCDCPAGSQGEDCGTVLLRPCTTEFRAGGDTPVGHIDGEGRDLGLTDPGYTESRCTGICDPVTARCFCDGKYRRVNPPQGSPPGTPAPVRGRPLGNHLCQVSDDGKGHKLEWGQVPWDQIYGPDGWCNSDKPVIRCGCLFDGFAGELCDEVTETMCANQCSGHGECDSGFCKCHPGWYGTDCARKAAGQTMEPGLHEVGSRPWLEDTVRIPPEAAVAAAVSGDSGGSGGGGGGGGSGGGSDPDPDPDGHPALMQGRRRPLIYVYDLPPAYNARMLQYRNDKGLCTWRSFGSGNRTDTTAWTYGLEVLMHEMMLQSEHRTFDPEQADFFYVPVYGSCFIFPIHCYADGPWWHAPSGPRVMHVTNMMLEVRDWVRKHFPYWDRRGGRDHIWLMTHDEGACYAPTEIYNTSIFLTHWGRTDPVHASNTAFTPDNYTQEFEHPQQPGGWLRLIAGHPCYTPGKDLVIPALKQPRHFQASPLLLHPPRQRDILLYLRGDVGKHRLPNYSRGIRQRLHALWRDQDWRGRHNVLIGDGQDVPGEYSEHLARAKFCVVAPGDGWSPRLEDAILHGCVPVIIMDGVQGVWEDQLEAGTLGLRVGEGEDLAGLPARLAAVPERVLQGMQQRLRAVWHRYAYASHPLLASELRSLIQQNVKVWQDKVLTQKGDSTGSGGGDGGSGGGPGSGSSGSGSGGGSEGAQRQRLAGAQLEERALAAAYTQQQDDAFHTILQWLYARIPHTRGGR